MSGFTFQRATKRRAKLRLALIGPAGSGKTWTALTLACALGQRVAVIDTEHGSASKYSDRFGFDAGELPDFSPAAYVQGIEAAGAAGYDVLVIDSLSHAWAGPGGALEMVDQIAARSQSKNNFAAWRDVTPQHNRLVDAIIGAPCHVIATLRSKTAYEVERDEKGRSHIRKLGLQPVQRDGLEYEFDVTADMDMDNTLIVGKTRCPDLAGRVIRKPDATLAATLAAWLGQGADAPPSPPAPPVPSSPANGEADLDAPIGPAKAAELRDYCRARGWEAHGPNGWLAVIGHHPSVDPGLITRRDARRVYAQARAMSVQTPAPPAAPTPTPAPADPTITTEQALQLEDELHRTGRDAAAVWRRLRAEPHPRGIEGLTASQWRTVMESLAQLPDQSAAPAAGGAP